MGVWREIMDRADRAKRALVDDKAAGENLFEELLRQYPGDGMVYFKRGEAYEALGEVKLARADYQRAMASFPKDDWKMRAKQAVSRLG